MVSGPTSGAVDLGRLKKKKKKKMMMKLQFCRCP